MQMTLQWMHVALEHAGSLPVPVSCAGSVPVSCAGSCVGSELPFKLYFPK